MSLFTIFDGKLLETVLYFVPTVELNCNMSYSSRMSTVNHSSTYNRTYERKVVEDGPRIGLPGGFSGIPDLSKLSSFQVVCFVI